MSLPTPELGSVIQFDFLWKNEALARQEDGTKDRPCVIVLAVDRQADNQTQVTVCPISHASPAPGQPAVPVPSRVATYIGLDDRQSWIKTNEVNRFPWPKSRLPFGIAKTPKGAWSYGHIPPGLFQIMRDQVIANNLDNTLKLIVREE